MDVLYDLSDISLNIICVRKAVCQEYDSQKQTVNAFQMVFKWLDIHWRISYIFFYKRSYFFSESLFLSCKQIPFWKKLYS